MKFLKPLVLLTLAGFTLLACQNDKTPSIAAESENLTQKIQELESTLFGQSGGEVVKDKTDIARELVALYEKYAQSEVADTAAAESLLKAADLSVNATRNFAKAIQLYEQVEKNYPNSSNAERALFLKAYTYENNLQNLDQAKAGYEAFLAKYPNSDLTDDAQFSLQNLGKSPDDIIKSFQQQKKK